MEKNKHFLYEDASPSRAVLTMALPTIVSQLVSMIYNMTDTYFVGQLGDPNQVAAVSIAAPVSLALTALSNLFGIGGASVFSRCLGKQDADRARHAAGFSFFAALLTSLLFSVFVGLFPGITADLLGSDTFTAPFTKRYLFWVVVCGAPFSLLSIVMSHFVRADGSARLAGLALSFGGLINLALDPLLIFGFGLGVSGAAIATLISNAFTFVLFLVYFLRRKRRTLSSFSCWRLPFERALGADVLCTGLPGMLQTILASLSNAVLNNLASAYGSTAVASLGIVKKLDQLPMSVTIGFAQGIVPLLSYAHGAGKTKRVNAVLRCATFYAVSFAIICVAVYELFPDTLIGLFIQDEATILTGIPLLRIMCVSTPLMSIAFMIITTFQAMGATRSASLLSVMRKGALDIPLLLIFGSLLPLWGLACVQPITESIAMLTALIMYYRLVTSQVN